MKIDREYIEQYFIYIGIRKYVKFNEDDTYSFVISTFQATHFDSFNEANEKAKLVTEETKIYKFITREQ